MTSIRLWILFVLLASSPRAQELAEGASRFSRTHVRSVAGAVFDLHLRPGSRAAASAEYLHWKLGRELDEMQARLDMQATERIQIYAYDDLDELALLTGVHGTGGFAVGTEVHLPYDNDQTRYHEVAHGLLAQLPETGDEERHAIFSEGFANALLVFTHHLHAHTVAAFEAERGVLPTLATLVDQDAFDAWHARHPEAFAYDIAASYMLHLMERHGAAAVKRYYGGASAEACFGAPLTELEEGWREHLSKRGPIPPEVNGLLRQRVGELHRFTSVPMAPRERLRQVVDVDASWSSLDGRELGDGSGDWTVQPAGFRGSPVAPEPPMTREEHTAEWSIRPLKHTDVHDGALWLTLEFDAEARPLIGLGRACRVEILPYGTVLYSDDRAVAINRYETTGFGRRVDLLLVREGTRARVYLDGFLTLEGVVSPAPGPIELGALAGPVVFQELRLAASVTR